MIRGPPLFSFSVLRQVRLANGRQVITGLLSDRRGRIEGRRFPSRRLEGRPMHSVKYVHWQDGDWWLGFLEEYPDYWTQGETLQDLVEHLKDLYLDLSGGNIPGARKVGELVMP